MNAMLSDKEYLRQRLEPRPGDDDYLHLSDLLIAIQAYIPAPSARVLDYGCGGSPYRSLFRAVEYHRADLAGGRDLDFEYGPDAQLPPEIGDYDYVFSSQVLEHVADPGTYLRECFRVLKPGGSLVVSTHGLFREHACPHDYWRWTGFGLKRAVETAGFSVVRLHKTTTGPRAAFNLAEKELQRTVFTSPDMMTRTLWVGIRAFRKLGLKRLHQTFDRNFSDHRMVGGDEWHDLYVGVIMQAIKPTAKS